MRIRTVKTADSERSVRSQSNDRNGQAVRVSSQHCRNSYAVIRAVGVRIITSLRNRSGVRLGEQVCDGDVVVATWAEAAGSKPTAKKFRTRRKAADRGTVFRTRGTGSYGKPQLNCFQRNYVQSEFGSAVRS